MIDWSTVASGDFEKLCGELLELNGFSNIEWFGSAGGDKGRDLVAHRTEEPLPGVRLAKKWLVQCKRYVRKRLSKLDIENFLVAAKEHSPDVTLLVTTTTLTPDVRDWLATVRKDYRFEILLWEERDLEREIRRHRDRISIILPPVVRQAGDPVLFYPVRPSETAYMCNEIEEIGFYVLNSGDAEGDILRIKRFIEFVRTNEIVFETRDPDGTTAST